MLTHSQLSRAKYARDFIEIGSLSFENYNYNIKQAIFIMSKYQGEANHCRVLFEIIRRELRHTKRSSCDLFSWVFYFKYI